MKNILIPFVLLCLAGCASSNHGLLTNLETLVSIDPQVDKSGITAWAWSPDGQYLATAGRDRIIRIWDTTDGSLKHKMFDPTNTREPMIFDLCWSPDGKRLASVGQDSMLKTWGIESSKPTSAWRAPSWLFCVAWSPDGKMLACGGASSVLRIFEAGDILDESRSMLLEGDRYDVKDIAWRPDSQRLVSGGVGDEEISVWDARTGAKLLKISGHGRIPNEPFSCQWPHVYDLEWSHDGSRVISSANDWTVRVWCAATGRQIFNFRAHKNGASSISWRSDDKYIASATYEPKRQLFRTPKWIPVCRIWDPQSRRQVGSVPGYMALWCPVGERIAWIGQDAKIRISRWRESNG